MRKMIEKRRKGVYKKRERMICNISRLNSTRETKSTKGADT